MSTTDRVPIGETYRGVGIHAGQAPERVKVVKAAIDTVIAASGVNWLVAYAGDARHPPEARLLAAAKAEAIFALAAEERRQRPDIDIEKLRASVAGLNSVTWLDRERHRSLFDPW